MNGSYFTNPLIFLVQVLGGFATLAVMLRFLLQLVRADFYNPLSQALVRITTPVLQPLRRLLPGFHGLDTASLVLAWLIKTLELGLIALLAGVGAAGALLWSLPALVQLVLNVFLFAILIRALLSWIHPDPYHPMSRLLDSLTDPILRPARQWLPPVGGMDFSPVLAMVALVVLEMLLLPPLKWLTGSPF